MQLIRNYRNKLSYSNISKCLNLTFGIVMNVKLLKLFTLLSTCPSLTDKYLTVKQNFFVRVHYQNQMGPRQVLLLEAPSHTVFLQNLLEERLISTSNYYFVPFEKISLMTAQPKHVGNKRNRNVMIIQNVSQTNNL